MEKPTIGGSRQDVPAAEHHLLDSIRAGDRNAFEVLFRTHHADMLRFARSQIRDAAAAEDIVHDVFLRVWRGRAALKVDRSVRAYLLAAVRHRVIDVARHRATDRRTIEYHPDLAASPAASAHGPDLDPAHVTELDRAIRAAIADLPERCRTAFLLCREQDLTYAEAAEVMGISPATVKTQIARALASLRDAVAPFLALVAAAATTLR